MPGAEHFQGQGQAQTGEALMAWFFIYVEEVVIRGAEVAVEAETVSEAVQIAMTKESSRRANWEEQICEARYAYSVKQADTGQEVEVGDCEQHEEITLGIGSLDQDLGKLQAHWDQRRLERNTASTNSLRPPQRL